MKKGILREVSSNERNTIVREYLGSYAAQRIADIKVFVLDGEKPAEFRWDAIAVKFATLLAEDTLIQLIVRMHVDDYWGMHDGYHLFWYD